MRTGFSQKDILFFHVEVSYGQPNFLKKMILCCSCVKKVNVWEEDVHIQRFN